MGRAIEILSVLIRHKVWKEPSPQKLCAFLEDLGPVYTKIGQIISSASDLLPAEYCAALAKLRTQASRIPAAEVRSIIEKEYGQRLEDVFPAFSDTVLGAASVAQVHAAKLQSGELVAVKVQRPGLYEKTEKDVRILRRLMKLLRFTPAKNVIDGDAVLDEFWAAAKNELDFITEAHNLDAFRKSCGKYPQVSCPKVYRRLCTPHILVMEYIEGVRADDTDLLTAAGIDREKLLLLIIRNYARQLLEDRFFHADPHPGNIMIRGQQIVWIDLGLVGSISEKNSRLLKQGIRAVIEMNAEKIADVLVKMGSDGQNTGHEELVSAIQEALNTFRSTPLEELDLRKFLESFLSAAKHGGITMPQGVTQLTRGVIVLKSIVDILKPDADVLYLLSAVLPALDFGNEKTGDENE